MATPNAPFVSGGPSNDGGWFSQIVDLGKSIVHDLAPIWAGNQPPTQASGNNAPSQGTNPTTGTLELPAAGALAPYMPALIVGGVLLAVVLIAKK